jgi:hypothetical protein
MWAVVTVPRRERMADAIIAQLREPVLKFGDTTGDIQANHILAWTKVCEFGSAWVGVIPGDVILADHSHSDGFLETVSDRWKRVDLTLILAIHRASAGTWASSRRCPENSAC